MRQSTLKIQFKIGLVLGVIAVLILSGCGSKGNEKVQAVEAKTKDTTTFQEIGFISVRDEKWNDLVSAIQNNITHSRKEPENLAFNLYQPEDGRHEAIWFERYRDNQGHDRHKQQDYFQSAIGVIKVSAKKEIRSITLQEIKGIPVVPSIIAGHMELTRNVIVFFDVKPDRTKDFIDAIMGIVKPSRSAPGNLGFNVFRFADDPNKFVLMENWENAVAHTTHEAQPYSKNVLIAFEGLFVSDPMKTRWLVKDISQPN